VNIMGENSPWGSNWVDNNAGVHVFSQGGKRYVYAEDVYLGKSNLYRIDALDTIHRDRYSFTWPGFANWDGTIHVNEAPTANPQAVTAVENTAKVITLTGADPDGDVLGFKVMRLP